MLANSEIYTYAYRDATSLLWIFYGAVALSIVLGFLLFLYAASPPLRRKKHRELPPRPYVGMSCFAFLTSLTLVASHAWVNPSEMVSISRSAEGLTLHYIIPQEAIFLSNDSLKAIELRNNRIAISTLDGKSFSSSFLAKAEQDKHLKALAK